MYGNTLYNLAMDGIKEYFPKYESLDGKTQALIKASAFLKHFNKGDMVSESSSCLGLVIVKSGQLRAYINSEEGREITLYRLFEYDLCLFSASCALRDLQFDIQIRAEKECDVFIIPTEIYKKLMETNLIIANYTNSVLSSRLSDVMWLLEQVVFKSLDKRLASLLLDEASFENSDILTTTHETLASHLGSAREVITRMLKYFQSEKLVSLSRGKIELLDKDRLEELAK